MFDVYVTEAMTVVGGLRTRPPNMFFLTERMRTFSFFSFVT